MPDRSVNLPPSFVAALLLLALREDSMGWTGEGGFIINAVCPPTRLPTFSPVRRLDLWIWTIFGRKEGLAKGFASRYRLSILPLGHLNLSSLCLAQFQHYGG